MRVTSSRVLSPVRTRYVTETQSGACPASVATVCSRRSTSLSSRGAMNSKEIVGRPRTSISAMRMVWALYQPRRWSERPPRGDCEKLSQSGLAPGLSPQQPGVADAAGDALRVEVFQECQHDSPAGTHAVAQLCNSDGSVGGDELLDDRQRRLITGAGERDIPANAHDLSTLDERAHELLGGAAPAHRSRQG